MAKSTQKYNYDNMEVQTEPATNSTEDNITNNSSKSDEPLGKKSY